MRGASEEMRDLRSNYIWGMCPAWYIVSLYQVVRVKSIIIMQKQDLFFTLIFSLLDQTIFLKLHTLFCMHVSLESFAN